MNVGQLRKVLEGLPADMPVTGFTTGDNEFPVAIVTIYERLPTIKARVMLGNDPNEFEPKYEKLLYADEIEGGG